MHRFLKSLAFQSCLFSSENRCKQFKALELNMKSKRVDLKFIRAKGYKRERFGVTVWWLAGTSASVNNFQCKKFCIMQHSLLKDLSFLKPRYASTKAYLSILLAKQGGIAFIFMSSLPFNRYCRNFFVLH